MLFPQIMLSAALLLASGSELLPVQVIDPQSNQVVKRFESSRRLDQTVDEMLLNLNRYRGVSLPDGMIVKIRFAAPKFVAYRSDVFRIHEAILIKNEKQTVIVLFDERNRPHLFTTSDKLNERLDKEL